MTASTRKKQMKKRVQGMKRAVIYARYSSHRQENGFSIEYQRDECMKYLERKGYKFIKCYIDEATTAKKTAGRDSFNEMIYDAQNGKFETIIVFSFSRSFRNTRDALNYHHELNENYGVSIESVIEQIDLSNPHGKFSGTNLFAMHELQSDITAGHVKAGMYVAAQQGYFLGGTCPFGYQLYGTGEYSRNKERKKYEAHPEEKEIVNEIFELYADGFSLDFIQTMLRDRGIKGRRGGIMTVQTIARILKNEFYIGTREYVVEGYPPLKIENCVPAIIDLALWHRVQLRHAENVLAKPRKTKRLYALTGKIVCEKCGAHMFGTHKGDKRNGKWSYSYYHCANKKSRKTCDAKNIRKDQLENYCLQQIKKHILNPDAIQQIAVHIAGIAGNEPTEIERKIKKLSKRRAELAGYIKGLVRKQLENNMPDDVYRELSGEYNTEIAEIDLQLMQLENSAQTAITPAAVEKYLNGMLANIDSADDEILKTIFDKLIDKILVNDDAVTVILTVSPYPRFRDKESQGQPNYTLSLTVKRQDLSGF